MTQPKTEQPAPTKEERDAYWGGQFDRARDMVGRLVKRAVDKDNIEPEALSMWLIEMACELQIAVDGEAEARKTLIEQIEEYFRDGPLP